MYGYSLLKLFSFSMCSSTFTLCIFYIYIRKGTHMLYSFGFNSSYKLILSKFQKNLFQTKEFSSFFSLNTNNKTIDHKIIKF